MESAESSPVITKEAAYKMGAKGGSVSAHERELFEEWLRGHCWDVGPKLESGEYANMLTRICWASWRDRAALAAIHGA